MGILVNPTGHLPCTCRGGILAFRYDGGIRSVQPDAFGILRRKDVIRPFFLEWERRAVRPGTMADRLAPYLRYYSTRRPLDDHGALPVVLVVLDDELAATHFLRVGRREMERAGVILPLLIAQESLLRQEGPLGAVWLTSGIGDMPSSPIVDFHVRSVGPYDWPLERKHGGKSWRPKSSHT